MKSAIQVTLLVGAMVTLTSEAVQGQDECDLCKTFTSVFCNGGVCHDHGDADGDLHPNTQNHGTSESYPGSCDGSHEFNENCGGAFLDILDAGEILDHLMHVGGGDRLRDVVASATISVRPLAEWPALELSKICSVTGLRVALVVPATTAFVAEVAALQEQPDG